MFDPLANALYAARFLSELYAETGNWTQAAGAFHSRTPELATKYAARFDMLRKRYLAEDSEQLRPTTPNALARNGGAVIVAASIPAQGAPLSAISGPSTPPALMPSSDTIPDIPDIVAMLSPPQPAPVPKINRYPLLQKQTTFTGTPGSVAAARTNLAPQDDTMIGPPAVPPTSAPVWTGSLFGPKANTIPRSSAGSLMRIASDAPTAGDAPE